MLETPDASPTWLSGTEAVAAADDGPLERPMPTATATSGRKNAAYCHDASANPIQAKPEAVIRKPMPTTCRPPSFTARRGTSGAETTRPTVAGRVASPASSGLKPSVLGFWK